MSKDDHFSTEVAMRGVRNFAFVVFVAVGILGFTRSATAMDWEEMWNETRECDWSYEENYLACEFACNLWQCTSFLAFYSDFGDGMCNYSCYANIPYR